MAKIFLARFILEESIKIDTEGKIITKTDHKPIDVPVVIIWVKILNLNRHLMETIYLLRKKIVTFKVIPELFHQYSYTSLIPTNLFNKKLFWMKFFGLSNLNHMTHLGEV